MSAPPFPDDLAASLYELVSGELDQDAPLARLAAVSIGSDDGEGDDDELPEAA